MRLVLSNSVLKSVFLCAPQGGKLPPFVVFSYFVEAPWGFSMGETLDLDPSDKRLIAAKLHLEDYLS